MCIFCLHHPVFKLLSWVRRRVDDRGDSPQFVSKTLTVDIRIKDINTHCLDQFRAHWECLDDNNHQMWQCRPAEWKLNKCAFEKLVRATRSEAQPRLPLPAISLTVSIAQGLEKVIPDQPKDSIPVQLRRKQVFAHNQIPRNQIPFVTPTQLEQLKALEGRGPSDAPHAPPNYTAPASS